MSNWLHEEENKKSILADKLLFVKNNLKQFYSICNRVNLVRPNSLSVNSLEITGQNKILIDPGPQSWESTPSDETHLKRGIFFEYNNTESIIINLFTRTIDGFAIDKGLEPTIICLKKIMKIEQLLEWNEENIINLLSWILYKINKIKNEIPGIELTVTNSNIKNTLLTNINEIQHRLDQEINILEYTKRFQIGRESWKKEYDIKLKTGLIHSLNNQINKLNLIITERFNNV